MALELEKYYLQSPYTGANYLQGLISLLPTGNIWVLTVGTGLLIANLLQDKILRTGFNTLQDLTTGETIQDIAASIETGDISNSTWGNLLSCFASELARVREYTVNLQNEAVPGLSIHLLPDWERVLGLPSECSLDTDIDTVGERQEIAHTKYYDSFQTTTITYLESIATDLGFTITINELEITDNSFRVGVVRMGGNRMGGAGSYAVLTITVEPGGTGSIEQLQCTFNKIKPAHTVIVWVLP